jgi:hypothetical protein
VRGLDGPGSAPLNGLPGAAKEEKIAAKEKKEQVLE